MPANTFDIRPLASDDRPVWAPLWRDYLAFYDTSVPPEIEDLTFARYTDPAREDMRAWLAWDGGQALGLVHVILHAHGWRAEPVAYLQDLYTATAARGRGIGRALIETVYADADAAARPDVYWLTHESNRVARSLYDRVARNTGFVRYARV
ncbi:MAG: GNAT family N-acetyltransferase [Pseudomonadota bacterium]